MTITDFIERFEQEVPPALAMTGDPVGMQVLPVDAPLTSVGVAYEIDRNIIERAAAEDVNLLVAFHPLIYPSVERITPATRVERCIIEMIQRDIALYIVHTAFDAHPRGTSRLLAEQLGLRNIRPLEPSTIREGSGMGAVGELEEELALDQLAERLRQTCSAECVRLSGNECLPARAMVRRVAILGGSGMSFYDAAVRAGADVFVTADVRYHAFHAANDRIPVLDPGHAESERFVAEGLAGLVSRVMDTTEAPVPVRLYDEPTNPVRYVIGTGQ